MSKRWKIGLPVAVLVVVLVVAGGVWWFFLRDDSPAAVDLDTASESVTPNTGGATSAPLTSVDGTWTVDNSSGEFDFESATGTFAGFRIKEELAGIGSTTAVGRTGDVTGTMSIEGTTLTAAQFDIDVSTITTNESRRDDRVQEALETDQFPTATFTLTAPVDLGADPQSGQDLSVTATGDFTVHGVTRQVEVPLQARLVDDTIVVVGSFDVTFSDYGVSVPRAAIVLSVEDHGILELQLLLVKQ
ncbi:MAG TPA: YceI family protein [Acidimicrobiales bacterium]